MIPLNDLPVYDVLCAQLDEQRLIDSPWFMGEWHPDGAHFWHASLPLNIVVTDWTEDDVYDVNIYTDAQMQDMGDALAYHHVPITEAGILLAGLLWGGEAERLHGSNPLPAPMPAEQMLAAYMAMVRGNGIWAVRNVAGVGDIPFAKGHPISAQQHRQNLGAHIYEIECEIVDLTGVADEEDTFDLLRTVARMAVDTCRIDLGLSPIRWDHEPFRPF
ncbi:MAG TPA: hypothetical protein VMW08_11870 [Acidimicrobiales bacterium]|nr:hypothetical protein [Acidimicrobiales bacterium]